MTARRPLARFAAFALMRATVALLPFAVGAPTAHAAAPAWIAASGTGCGGEPRIAAEIDRLVADLVADRAAAALLVSRAGPGALRVRLVYRASAYERLLVFSPEDCGELAQTVAVVVRGWLQRPVRSFAEAVSSMAPATAEARAPDPAPPPAPVPVATSAAPSAPPTATPFALSVGLALFNGGDRANRGFAGAIAFDWDGSPRWGFTALASTATGLEGRAGAGSVAVTPVAVAAAARFSPLTLGALRLDLVAGPAFAFLWARSRGYAVRNSSALLAQPALVALARARVEVEVQPIGTVLAITRVHAGMGFGVARSFD